MLRNASIRARVLAILSVPLLVLMIAGGVLLVSSVATARAAQQLSGAVGSEASALTLVGALDDERQLTQQVLSGDTGAKGALAAARSATDPRLAAEGARLAAIDPAQLSPQVRRAVDDAASAGRRVRALRTQIDSGATSPDAAVGAYDAVIDDQVQLPARLASSVHAPATADALRASTSVARLSQLLIDERDLGQAALADGNITSDERLALAGVQAQEDAQRADAATTARSAGVSLPQASADLGAARTAALGGAAGGRSTLGPGPWGDVLNAEVSHLSGVRAKLQSLAVAGVERQADTARRNAWLMALVVLAGVVLPIVLALVLTRRLTEPLRALTEAAATVRRRLPRLVQQAQGAPGGAAAIDDAQLPVIPVRSRDEVGRLAEAFNEVNATTVSVAREQAALRSAIATTFVTLARRDQALLARQLTFIDDLERAQEDPRVLEDLFVLDHLATRMRRNAESLLVLAGLEPGRRLRQSMALSDVVRTAISEVEDYRRVDLTVVDDPDVVPHAALGTAHLVAELLENALAASDPTTRVDLSAAASGDGSIIVSVTDSGIGMSAEARARNAARIADPSATAALGASELGFFVVGRLAQRYGIAVSLRAGARRGTVVDVTIPATLLAAPTSAATLPEAPPFTAPEPAAPTPVPVSGRRDVLVGAVGAATAATSGQEGQTYQPTRLATASAALPGRAERGEDGGYQPLTRRERKAVETGGVPVVAASTPAAAAPAPAPAPTAPAPAPTEFRAGASAAPLTRRHRRSSEARESAPRTGPEPAWPTPAEGLTAVGQDAPRRRDPADVRRLLAGYQAGVSRGRRSNDVPQPPATPEVRESV